ncbi:LysR family transcriptional regulator [Sneathiella chinensis]|uniref:Transcriptional regulator n=1 Tax=Sneathiella chinensis TaxID=349750 RepID=A0ABQ5U6I4_9PROT|nr:LysR family transcriptional regulator [Sneathiella chinensis]GLQ06828.1 transcriptional regulator [Sneathiella chinensis]
MNLRSLDLNLLLTFEVIYDSGNLTQAARVLNVTQPAVSNALLRLRDHFSDSLFVHSDRRMKPTPFAEELILPVRQALDLLRQGLGKKDSFDPSSLTRAVRLSIGDIGETILLPEFVKRLRREAPDIRIHVFQTERRNMAKSLAANDIDFAVDIPLQGGEQISTLPVISECQVCAISPAHPLASRKALALSDYLALEHIHVSSRKTGGGVADVELGRQGLTRKHAVRLQHYQSAFALLAETELALTVPESLARVYECVSFPLPFPVPPLDLHLYWHRNAEGNAFHGWVRNILLEIFDDLQEQKA